MIFIMTHVAGVCGTALFLFIMYHVFLSDYLHSLLAARKERKDQMGSVRKIARLKAVSDDPKDISKFITEYAALLSDDLVKSLVTRIETLKDDQVITSDNVLKRQIDELESRSVAHTAARK